jgi:hypothetical protein
VALAIVGFSVLLSVLRGFVRELLRLPLGDRIHRRPAVRRRSVAMLAEFPSEEFAGSPVSPRCSDGAAAMSLSPWCRSW